MTPIMTALEEIFNFITSSDSGTPETNIISHFSSFEKQTIQSHINTLIKTKRVEIVQNAPSLSYKKVAPPEEHIIYNLIKSSNGLWLRDIKLKTNLNHILITKILKQMENKKLIKAVKNVKSNRKVYVLYDAKIGDDLLGGIWFSEGEVDSEFVDEIGWVVLAFLLQNTDLCDDKTLKNIFEIKTFLEASKIAKVEIKNEDLEVLLKVMEYDGLIQEIIDGNEIKYRALIK